MPPDPEQATEHTKLLYSIVNDRRLSAVRHEDEASSIIASYVSKNEQALSNATVGERLPYNDYTTIDWLHDLVSFLYFTERVTTNNVLRSKTPTVFVLSILEKAFAILYSLHSTLVRDGSPLPSSVS